jgi:signal transduction histidine kinase
MVMPLVRAGTVDWVLIVGRRTDRPFTRVDVDQLQELGAVAALLIRNARLLAEAESASRAKSAFINLAAHELGTPISVIRGYADMLAEETFGPITQEQRRPVESIRNMSGDLAGRVQQLLVASRLEAGVEGPPGFTPTSSDVHTVVENALMRAEDRARLIGASLAADPPAGPVMVSGPEGDLGMILDNLINNAMTYSHPPARVAIQVMAGDEIVEVRVVDSGIGVPAADRERIFEQFYRVDDVEFGYPSGTGLGLYISRRMAERYGGQLFLERSDRTGSVFTLRLQRANA